VMASIDTYIRYAPALGNTGRVLDWIIEAEKAKKS
jgi:hypothetical protein